MIRRQASMAESVDAVYDLIDHARASRRRGSCLVVGAPACRRDETRLALRRVDHPAGDLDVFVEVIARADAVVAVCDDQRLSSSAADKQNRR